MENIHKENKKIKIAIGLSGGVDSSVTALLLKQKGYDLTGVYIQCWDEKADGCTAEEDRASAVAVATKLEIPFRHLNFVKDYKEKVISYFYDEYKKGRTPNPDIVCNTDIKFGMFLDWAIENGFDYVATGHYARLSGCDAAAGEDLLLCSHALTAVKDSPSQQKTSHYHLLHGKDAGKDQSYFLYRLTQDQLSKSVFPLGNLEKSRVRELAKEAGLPTAHRPDSQGICFIGKVDVKEFLKKQIDIKEGDLLFKDGRIVGTHDGAWFYTIGQRHGFRVNEYFGLPLYVMDKDVSNNTVVVGYADDVNKSEFEVSQMHWIVDQPEDTEFDCLVRIRHLGKLHKAKVIKVEEDVYKVEMESKTFGIAPGQSAVFYYGDVVLGGGIIK